jgi:tetratricopeptide (TPR) repeat protein
MMLGTVFMRPVFLASALGAGMGLVAAACASAGEMATSPRVSPTGIVYEPGTPPRDTRYSQTAELYLRSNRPERALELAQDGIAYEPSNPVHWYLAGLALLRLDRLEAADSMLAEAQRVYPAYELDIEPLREAAWADAFNRGSEAYRRSHEDAAVRSWSAATAIFDLRPDAHHNLATIHYGAGRYDEAIALYRRAVAGLDRRPATRVLDPEALARRAAERDRMENRLVDLLLATGRAHEAEPLLQRRLERDPRNTFTRQHLAAAMVAAGREDDARALLAELLAEDDLAGSDLFAAGVALFRLEDYAGAAAAFRRLTALRPNSRDAWFNLANSLFAAGAWEALVAAGGRLIELDPLNENAALITARAHLELGDEEVARRELERIGTAPVHLDALATRTLPDATGLQGRVVGNRARPGQRVRLRFVFYGDAGELGAETVALEAPAPGESRVFDITFPTRAVGYRYELVP